METSTLVIGLLGGGIFLGLILIGMPIAFAAGVMGLAGLCVVTGPRPAFTVVGLLPHDAASNYVYAVLPLFILTGNLAYHAGIVQDIFGTMQRWVGWMPGGLASATVLGGAAFGAVSGSSVAAAAVLTKVALPEMEKYNYDRKLIAGTVGASGTLAAVIPPSALVVIYGIMTEQSIAKLLIAGIIPGIIMAILFIVVITVRATLNPALGPRVHGVSWRERLRSIKGVWGVTLLAVLVIGGIYTGVFTATEAGAVGVMGAFLIAVFIRRLTRASLWDSLLDSARTTSMIFLVIVGTMIFARFLAFTRIPYNIASFITGLPVSPLVILIGIIVLYLILGMFMDPISMLILTIPVVFPTSIALGFDPIWFGIIVVLMSEISMLTPPVGLNLYVVKGVAPHIPMEDIIRGVFPLFLANVAVVILIVAVPQLALFLPATMRGT